MDKPNIAELAVAAWRLERWLENLNAERKLAAKKSLREIKTYLEASGIEIVDPLGWKFDEGLSLQIVNNEADDEEDVIVVQTTAPIIKKDGAVIQSGKVILGKDIKEQKSNSEIKKDRQQAPSTNQSQESGQSNDDAILAESQLAIQQDACWVRIFDLRGVKDGFQAAIMVSADFDADMLLMDEQVWKDNCGNNDRSRFRYNAKAGESVIVPPYPDVWYVFAYPPIGHFCHEYSFNMNWIWVEKRTEFTQNAYPNQSTDKANNSDHHMRDSEAGSAEFVNVPANEENAPNIEAATASEEDGSKESAAGIDEERRKKIKFWNMF